MFNWLNSLAKHLDRLATARSGRFWLLLCILLIIGVAYVGYSLQQIDIELKQPAGFGIVKLEFAADGDRAGEIRKNWADSGLIEHARRSLLLDLPFIFFYAGALTVCFLGFAKVAGGRHSRWIAVLALLPLSAAGLDLLENASLWHILDTTGAIGNALPLVATIAALVKFLLLLVAINAAVALIMFGLFAWFTRYDAMGKGSDKLCDLTQVCRDEQLYLHSRREQAEVPLRKSLVGLASSGGGIRSATVNLGVVQVLLDQNQLKQVDYHSTVSGGGYLGTALGSLLSFREPKPGEPTVGGKDQYRFAAGDKPYFDVARRTKLPLPVCEGHVDANRPAVVTRTEVLDHLRAFGEFLVRRRRLLSRDVLRAAGTVIVGMLATFSLFLLTAGVLTMGVLLLDDLASAIPSAVDCLLLAPETVFEYPDCNPSKFSLGSAVLQQLGQASLSVALMGMLVGGLTMLVTGWLVGQLPKNWLLRDGDIQAETREYRALWVFGLMVTVFAFALPRLALEIAGKTSGSLSPTVFLLGVAAAGALAYMLQTLVSFDLAEKRFTMELWRATRSFTSSVFGLSLLLALTAAFMGVLPELAVALIDLGRDKTDPTIVYGSGLEIAGIGGAISALLAGVLAWKKQLHAAEQSPGRAGPMVKRLLAMGGFIQRFVLGVAVVLFIAAVLVVFTALAPALNQQALSLLPFWFDALSPYLAGFGVGFVLLIAGGNLLDFNRLSLHYFYRDRLAEAYMRTLGQDEAQARSLRVKRDNSEIHLWQMHGAVTDSEAGDEGIQVTTVEEQAGWIERFTAIKAVPTKKISVSGAATSAPYLLYSTCLNLTTDRDMRHRTRKSDIFIFSKLYCGSRTTGFVNTRYYRSGKTKAAAAMTVSGAAADSAIGRESFFAQSFAAALFNVRLGQWLENPLYKSGAWAYRLENRVFWPIYLLFEALGMSDCRHRLVHLSDGGHTGDNLGLIPLLQRRCRLIIAVDAEHDLEYGFGSYIIAKRYARVDENTLIHMNLDRVRPDPDTGLCADPFACGRIEYRNAANRVEETGFLILIKSALTADMPASLRRYAERYPDFPHDTTADQFFTEDQFEAYRILGQVMAKMMLEAMPGLLEKDVDCDRLWREYCVWSSIRSST